MRVAMSASQHVVIQHDGRVFLWTLHSPEQQHAVTCYVHVHVAIARVEYVADARSRGLRVFDGVLSAYEDALRAHAQLPEVGWTC